MMKKIVMWLSITVLNSVGMQVSIVPELFQQLFPLPYDEHALNQPEYCIDDEIIEEKNSFCVVLKEQLSQEEKNTLLRDLLVRDSESPYNYELLRTARACALYMGAHPYVKKKNNTSDTVLRYSIMANDYPLTAYVLEKNANPTQEKVLFYVMSVPMAQLLMRYGADVYAKTEHGGSLLHRAPVCPFVLLQFYVNTCKLDTNKSDKLGNTPLHRLAIAMTSNAFKENDIIRKTLFLIQAGADPNNKNKFKKIPSDYVKSSLQGIFQGQRIRYHVKNSIYNKSCIGYRIDPLLRKAYEIKNKKIDINTLTSDVCSRSFPYQEGSAPEDEITDDLIEGTNRICVYLKYLLSQEQKNRLLKKILPAVIDQYSYVRDRTAFATAIFIGADIKMSDRWGETVLYKSMQMKDYWLALYFLHNGARIDTICNGYKLITRASTGSIAQLLKQYGAVLQEEDKIPTMQCALECNTEPSTLGYYLHEGILNASAVLDEQGVSPLMMLLHNVHEYCKELEEMREHDMHDYSLNKPELKEKICLLLQYGADLDYKDNNDKTLDDKVTELIQENREYGYNSDALYYFINTVREYTDNNNEVNNAC